MALPASLSSVTPAGSDSPSLGDDQFRSKSLALIDILGIPDATSITQAAFDIDAGGLAQVIFYDPAVTPASGELGRSGSTLYYRITGSHTNTVLDALGIIADTSGTPAASIGTGLLLQSESGDEAPSDILRLAGVFTDVGAGTEDSVLSVYLRTAGAALGERYRFAATGAFSATLTHANTTARTYTLPDATGTLMVALTRSTQDVTASETTTSTSYTDLSTPGPAVTLTPGRTTDQFIIVSARMANDGTSSLVHMSPAIAGAAAVDVNGAQMRNSSTASDVNSPNVHERHTLATSVADGSTHTAKYKTSLNTATINDRRISAFTLS